MSRDSLDVFVQWETWKEKKYWQSSKTLLLVSVALFSYLTIYKIATRWSYNQCPFSFCLDSRKFLNFVLK